MWGCGGWRFGTDVGGQKGVIALGVCRAGDGDKGSGFGLEEENTLGNGVCSDWVCRGRAGGQLRRFRWCSMLVVREVVFGLFVWMLCYPGPGTSLQEVWISVARGGNLPLPHHRRRPHQHRTSSRYSSAHILPPLIPNSPPTQKSASAIPSGPRCALTSPALAKPDEESLIPRIMESAQGRSRET